MARPPKYQVLLSEKDRHKLEAITSKGRTSARILKRAQILLKADQSLGHCLKNDEIAEMLEVSPGTVQNMRERYCKEALKCLYDKPRPGRPRIIDGEIEAKMISIACSEPPKGRERWTIRMITKRLIELECLENISHQGVYKRLKQMNLSLG
jgi:transposase